MSEHNSDCPFKYKPVSNVIKDTKSVSVSSFVILETARPNMTVHPLFTLKNTDFLPQYFVLFSSKPYQYTVYVFEMQNGLRYKSSRAFDVSLFGRYIFIF